MGPRGRSAVRTRVQIPFRQKEFPRRPKERNKESKGIPGDSWEFLSFKKESKGTMPIFFGGTGLAKRNEKERKGILNLKVLHYP